MHGGGALEAVRRSATCTGVGPRRKAGNPQHARGWGLVGRQDIGRAVQGDQSMARNIYKLSNNLIMKPVNVVIICRKIIK